MAFGIFAGPRAKTANMTLLERAKAMEEAGAHRNAIWGEAGWGRGTEGKWRFEIPDDRSGYVDKEGGVGRLPDYLVHKEFYEAYPRAKDAQVLTGGMPGANFSGNWNDLSPGGGALIGLGQPADARHAMALHEAQHGVNKTEGFVAGSSPERAAEPALDAINSRMKFLAKQMRELEIPGKYRQYRDPEGYKLAEEYDRLMSERGNINGRDLYHRSAGEVEARNVMARMNMTPEERRAKPPWETADVPEAQQIIQLENPLYEPQMSTQDILKLYRGESVHNKKGGPYYTPDREWARQFTQSGQDHEIKSASVKGSDVYRPSEPVYAGDPDAIDRVVAEARSKGFKAVHLDEGAGQPGSIYVFNKTALGR